MCVLQKETEIEIDGINEREKEREKERKRERERERESLTYILNVSETPIKYTINLIYLVT